MNMRLPAPDPRAPTLPADCWNAIGIHGDRSCAELDRHIHCRNCPTYSAAALTLLDRELSDTDHATDADFTRPKTVLQIGTQSVVVFRIAEEWLGLAIPAVMEVGNLRNIHSVPHRRGALLGVANIDGELVVAVSLARILGIGDLVASSPITKNAGTRVLVIAQKDVRAVCPVDEVCGIHRFHPRVLQDAPAMVARSASTFVKKVLRWRDHPVGILDEELLFSSLKRSVA